MIRAFGILAVLAVLWGLAAHLGGAGRAGRAGCGGTGGAGGGPKGRGEARGACPAHRGAGGGAARGRTGSGGSGAGAADVRHREHRGLRRRCRRVAVLRVRSRRVPPVAGAGVRRSGQRRAPLDGARTGAAGPACRIRRRNRGAAPHGGLAPGLGAAGVRRRRASGCWRQRSRCCSGSCRSPPLPSRASPRFPWRRCRRPRRNWSSPSSMRAAGRGLRCWHYGPC